MRKFVVVMWVLFSASVFALSVVAQRRGRARARATNNAAASAAAMDRSAPTSARIAQELGGIQWGWNKDQVIEHFRRALVAQYQPLLRNKGQVEQDRLMQERDQQLQALRQSFVEFNGRVGQRRWDTSFIGDEYTHNNNESMILFEDPRNGNREFFFFIGGKLWKRVQARAIPRGSHPDFATFVSGLDHLFGQGQRRMSQQDPNKIEMVVWQDPTTRLRVTDRSTFYGAYLLAYEDKPTLGRLAELRRNAPVKTASNTTAKVAVDDPHVGNVDADPNEDIVDRVTGKIRRVQSVPDAGAAHPAATPATPPPSNTRNRGASTGSPARQGPEDPTRGL